VAQQPGSIAERVQKAQEEKERMQREHEEE
jgi:hypothetical protein